MREYTIHATEFEWTILRNGRVIVTDNIREFHSHSVVAFSKKQAIWKWVNLELKPEYMRKYNLSSSYFGLVYSLAFRDIKAIEGKLIQTIPSSPTQQYEQISIFDLMKEAK